MSILPLPLKPRVRTFVLALSALSLLGFGSVLAFGLRDPRALSFLDIPLHAVGGAIAGLAFVTLTSRVLPCEILERVPRLFLALCTVSFAALVAVSWEFLELFADANLATGLQKSIAETLKDVALGLCGGLASAACWPPREAWHSAKGLHKALGRVSPEIPSPRH